MLKWVLVLFLTLHSSFALLHVLRAQCQLTCSFNTHLCGTMVVPSRHFLDGNGHCRVAGLGGITVETYTLGWNGTLDWRRFGLIRINMSPPK